MPTTPPPTDKQLAELHQVLAKAVPTDLPDEQRLPMLLEMADLCATLGQHQEAENNLRQQALPCASRLNDLATQSLIHNKIADLLLAQGNLDAAIAEQRLRQPLTAADDQAGQAHIKFSIAQLRLHRGDHRQGAAQAIFEDLADAYSTAKKLGQADGVGGIGLLLAQMLAMGGDKDGALRVTDEAEAAFRHLGDEANVAQLLSMRDAITGLDN